MMKRFFGGLTLVAVLSAPTALTSCNEDDINTVLEILDQILQSSDELVGTAWITSDNTVAMEFASGSSAIYYDTDNTTGVNCSYSIDTTNNVLTLNFSNDSVKYTIVSFTAGSSLVLRTSSGKTLRFVPYTGDASRVQ